MAEIFTNEYAWLFVVVLHLALTAIYYAVVRRFTVKLQALTETVIVFFIPICGFFILSLYRIIYRFVYRNVKPQAHKLNNKNTVFTSMTSYDENVIPLNDTFLVEDVKRKRRVFLDAVKQNVLQNPKVLRMATHDSDREIAYYAVSMLSTRIETLEGAMSESENKLQQSVNRNNMPLMSKYAEQLSEYVQQEFIDPLTRKDKRRIYRELLIQLMKEDGEATKKQRKHYYLEQLSQEMALEMYIEAEETCTNFQEEFPDDEDSYMSFIRLYHAMRNLSKMQAKIDELKATPIMLSVEALRTIRYWGGVRRG